MTLQLPRKVKLSSKTSILTLFLVSLHNKPSDKHKSANKAPQLKLFKQLMKAPMKPKLKAKPTEEELKEIFDRICMEIRVASEILH